MTGLTSLQRLFAIAVVGIAMTACGFGDNRNHQVGDDVGPVCGDGFIDPGEECDDENLDDLDGCDSICDVEDGWNCVGEPSDCTMGASVCGDGAIANGEDCDDADTAGGDGCSGNCDVEPGWECHGSPSQCNLLCGNGHVDPGEQCDGGADCDATCHLINPVSCDLIPQDGCTAGFACDIADVDGNGECRPITVDGGEDDSCNSSANACGAGFTCVGQSPTVDVCTQMCHTDAQCDAPNGSRCIGSLIDSGTGEEIQNINICSNACDPIGQTGCTAGLRCIAGGMTGGDITDCAEPGTRAFGATCSSTTDCVAGGICVDDGTDMLCRRMCEVDTTDHCMGTPVCTGFTDPLLIGAEEIGACL